MPDLEIKTKTAKVWKRRDFIKAWQSIGTKHDNWEDFYEAMNGLRVAAGCEPYKSDAGLNIQIGKIKKGLKDLGYNHPAYPAKPPPQKDKPVTLGEDADALGLTKI